MADTNLKNKQVKVVENENSKVVDSKQSKTVEVKKDTVLPKKIKEKPVEKKRPGIKAKIVSVTEEALRLDKKAEKALLDRKREKDSLGGVRTLRELDLAVDEVFLEHDDIAHEKIRMRKKLGMTVPKIKEQKLGFYDRYRLRLYRAGIESDAVGFLKLILFSSFGIIALLTGFLAVFWTVELGFSGINLFWFILSLVGTWTLGLVVVYSLAILVIHMYLDIVAFKRCLELERVLPEFLRLVATNYRSGLPLDKAIHKSNRKRFGVLSSEIDLVAKITHVKGDLAKALTLLGKKFDSKILQRAMTNITLSINSGSNISSLLEDIATNITKMRILRSSMAANVKNYVIFIIVAGVVIAPLMFAMSGQMNATIGDIRGSLSEGASEQSTELLMQVPTDGGLDPENFDTFAILMILTNSVTSACIISMIQHGNYKQGLKEIPLYAIISLLLYFAGSYVMGQVVTIV